MYHGQKQLDLYYMLLQVDVVVHVLNGITWSVTNLLLSHLI